MPPIENGAVLSSLPKERNLWYLWLSLNFRLSGMWYVMCVCVCVCTCVARVCEYVHLYVYGMYVWDIWLL